MSGLNDDVFGNAKQDLKQFFKPQRKRSADYLAEGRLCAVLKKHLHFMMRAGKIRAWSRLQSGMVRVQYPGGKAYWVELCEEGTPDFFVVPMDGITTWIEAKSSVGQLRPGQKSFRDRVGSACYQRYMKINSMQDLDELLDMLEGVVDIEPESK